LKNFEKHWIECILSAKEDPAGNAEMLLLNLIDEINKATCARAQDNIVSLSKRTYFQDFAGAHWVAMPNPAGWLTAKVTINGYTLNTAHTSSIQAIQYILSLNLTTTTGEQAIVIENSAQFRIVGSMTQAYNDFKDGSLPLVRYQMESIRLLEEYNEFRSSTV
jgi:hypothetical protein